MNRYSLLGALLLFGWTAVAWVPAHHSCHSSSRLPFLVPSAISHLYTSTSLGMTEASSNTPTTFREAEVMGLRYMQEGNYQDALDTFQKGIKLPGSRPDVIRTKMWSGPSPVGGAAGGTDSQAVLTLDEFELQAAHYNMACAHAQLGNAVEAVANLKLSFDNGFDNYAAVQADPDLAAIQETEDFRDLMEAYNPSKGFNPFGFFSSSN